MNGKELKKINIMITYDKEVNKHKEKLSAYDNNGKEKIPSTFEKKEKYLMVMLVCMNAVNTYFIQRMNTRVKHMIKPSLRWKILAKYTNTRYKKYVP